MFTYGFSALGAAFIAAGILTTACGSSSATRAPTFDEDPSSMNDMMAYLDRAGWLLKNIDIGAEFGKAMDSIGQSSDLLPAGSLGDTLDGRQFSDVEATLHRVTQTKAGVVFSGVTVRYLSGDGSFQRKLMLRDGEPDQCVVSREQTTSEFFGSFGEGESANRTVADFWRNTETNRWMLLKAEGSVPPVATQQRIFAECMEIATRLRSLSEAP